VGDSVKQGPYGPKDRFFQLDKMIKTVKIVLSVGLAFIFTSWIAPGDLNLSQTIVQGILVLAAGLWLTEAVPAFAVGFLIIFLTTATLSVVGGTSFPISIMYNTWSSPVIFLLLGGFVLAEAVTIVGLDKRIVSYAFRIFGSRPQRLLLGLMATSAALSTVMSNTATTALMTAGGSGAGETRIETELRKSNRTGYRYGGGRRRNRYSSRLSS